MASKAKVVRFVETDPEIFTYSQRARIVSSSENDFDSEDSSDDESLGSQNEDLPWIPTAVDENKFACFIESDHGRLRRRQRQIHATDIQQAKEHGEKRKGYPQPNCNPTIVYKYNDITYIENERTGEEVTCYATPIPMEKVTVDEEHRSLIETARQAPKTSWKSSTVVVVDTSGSMRQSDVVGARTRLHAVWRALADDFIAPALEKAECSPMDSVTILLLGTGVRRLFQHVPWSWELYNKVVEIYRTERVFPRGHGCFRPSLQEAERILAEEENTSATVNLMAQILTSSTSTVSNTRLARILVPRLTNSTVLTSA